MSGAVAGEAPPADPATARGPAEAPGEAAGERQVPFYCPYCGEEGLRPSGAQAGGWTCTACARGFTLRFAGVTPAGGHS